MIRSPELAHGVHALLEAAAMMIGARYYLTLRRRDGQISVLQGQGFALLAGCLIGAALGNKLVFWLEMPQLWSPTQGWLQFLLGGQSMVGGLLGGLIGVEIAKRFAGIRYSTGDLFVFPLLLALAIGRIGCFLAGLHDDTFGLPTGLPWGIDFGDGVPRHPTQLYEIVFVAGLWALLSQLKPFIAAVPGLLFKIFLSAYLLWRLCIDFLKPVTHAYAFGLSGIQWVCLIAATLYLPIVFADARVLLRNRAACERGTAP